MVEKGWSQKNHGKIRKKFVDKLQKSVFYSASYLYGSVFADAHSSMDLSMRQMILLEELGQRKDSLPDSSSVYKRGQADDYPSGRTICVVRLVSRTCWRSSS